MAISDIRLQHFRSYTDETFEVSPGVNIIVGPNASGKTNLLEAILVSTTGKSYRVKDQELIQFSKTWARIDVHTNQDERSIKLERNEHELVQKSYIINGQVLRKLVLSRTLPVVLFEPTNLQLLTGRPEQRRDFIDVLLEQSVDGYGRLLRQYKRTLAQRNALLKMADARTPQLFAWNVRLSELGGQIAAERQKLLSMLNKDLTKLYNSLANGKNKVTLTYQSSCGNGTYSSQLLKKLESSLQLDIARGFTNHGPHRDDIMIELNGHLLQEAASRGETRTMLLALKIAEVRLLEQVREQPPILLLDDVFSELDGARRQALTEFLQTYQSFITTTDADVVVQHFLDKGHIIPLG